MRILLICPSLPYPPNGGEEIRIFNLIKRLGQQHTIEVIAIDNGSVRSDDIVQLKKYSNKVYLAAADKKPKLLQWIKVAARLFKGEPFLTKYAVSDELEKLIYRLTSKRNYDLIQFENSYMARNIEFLNSQQKAKTILTMHNITSIQFYRMFRAEKVLRKKLKYFFTWFPMLRWESMIANKFDKIFVVSEVDRILLQAIKPGMDVSVVPNGIDTVLCNPSKAGMKRENNILIVGSMDYEPNVDAVMYFYREILPLIRNKLPECTLTIVGRNVPFAVQKLKAEPKIMIESNVREVSSYYEKALVSVAALRSGGGTRLKILESMAFGIPVVSTSIGCEGLDVVDGEHLLIGDNPEQFAEKTIRLFTDRKLYQHISANGRHLVETRYDWDKIAGLLMEVFEEMLGQSDLPKLMERE